MWVTIFKYDSISRFYLVSIGFYSVKIRSFQNTKFTTSWSGHQELINLQHKMWDKLDIESIILMADFAACQILTLRFCQLKDQLSQSLLIQFSKFLCIYIIYNLKISHRTSITISILSITISILSLLSSASLSITVHTTLLTVVLKHFPLLLFIYFKNQRGIYEIFVFCCRIS